MQYNAAIDASAGTPAAATVEDSVAIVREVLPLMSRLGIATTPTNYAVWYEYVVGRDPEVRSRLQGVVDGEAAFDQAVADELYERIFIAPRATEFSAMGQQFQGIMDVLTTQMSALGHDIGRYGATLSDCSEGISDDMSKEAVQAMVGTLVAETQRARERSQEVESNLSSMADEVQQLRNQVEQLNKDSNTDALTGINNRRAFDQGLEKFAAEAGERDRDALCLVLCDIDHFKSFNDNHGHLMGDRVLRLVAQEMQQCVKGRDLLARYGGEEFALLLPHTTLQGARVLADSLRVLVETQDVVNEDTGEDIGPVTISMGIARYRPGEALPSFIERADKALYASKEAGRNRVTCEE